MADLLATRRRHLSADGITNCRAEIEAPSHALAKRTGDVEERLVVRAKRRPPGLQMPELLGVDRKSGRSARLRHPETNPGSRGWPASAGAVARSSRRRACRACAPRGLRGAERITNVARPLVRLGQSLRSWRRTPRRRSSRQAYRLIYRRFARREIGLAASSDPKEGDMTNFAPWVLVIVGIVVLVISLSGQHAASIALLGIVVGAAAVFLGLRWRRRLVGASKP